MSANKPGFIKRNNQRYLHRFDQMRPSWSAFAHGRFIVNKGCEVFTKPRPKVIDRYEMEMDLLAAFAQYMEWKLPNRHAYL